MHALNVQCMTRFGNGMMLRQLPIGEVPHPILRFGTGIYLVDPSTGKIGGWVCLHLFSALHTTRSHRAV